VLYDDWFCLEERIEAVTGEIEKLSHIEPKCQRLMSVPGVGPAISTALVAAIDSGEAFDRGRDSLPGWAWCPANTAPADAQFSAASPSGAADTCAPC